MKRFLIALVSLIFIYLPIESNAQKKKFRYPYAAVGVFAGSTHYQGDLDDNGFDWWNVFVAGANNNVGSPFKLLRPGFGVNFYYRFHPHMFADLRFHQGWIGADDKNETDPFRIRRNLNFSSHLTEFAATLGYEFYGNQRRFVFRKPFTPYVFAGVAVFNFNPKAMPEDAWFDINEDVTQTLAKLGVKKGEKRALHPMGTEGQYLNDPDDRYPEPYSLTQISIPIGVGFRWALNKRMDLHFRVGLRKTFTDYLDDVSSQMYPDPIALMESQYPEAALFSDRSIYTDYGKQIALVLAGQAPQSSLWTAYNAQQFDIQTNGKTNERRGQPNQLDWYGTISLGLTYIITKEDKCPRFRF